MANPFSFLKRPKPIQSLDDVLRPSEHRALLDKLAALKLDEVEAIVCLVKSKDGVSVECSGVDELRMIVLIQLGLDAVLHSDGSDENV